MDWDEYENRCHQEQRKVFIAVCSGVAPFGRFVDLRAACHARDDSPEAWEEVWNRLSVWQPKDGDEGVAVTACAQVVIRTWRGLLVRQSFERDALLRQLAKQLEVPGLPRFCDVVRNRM